jgi:hypothetical protein
MVKVEIKDGILVIEIPVKNPPSLSATGKTLLVASTHGNIPTDTLVDGKPLTVAVNAYIRAK